MKDPSTAASSRSSGAHPSPRPTASDLPWPSTLVPANPAFQIVSVVWGGIAPSIHGIIPPCFGGTLTVHCCKTPAAPGGARLALHEGMIARAFRWIAGVRLRHARMDHWESATARGDRALLLAASAGAGSRGLAPSVSSARGGAHCG